MKTEEKLTHWHVIYLLLQVDPPARADGASYLDGINEGVYLAQCHLTGVAQGAAGAGNYAEAMVAARSAVALNGLRQLPTESDQETD